ncbi:MAG: S8/S53 family peptidase [Deltaproteobacteria bacterium]|nr:S8/S53 family peptidase [Deltaproteobacteria bacterium]
MEITVSLRGPALPDADDLPGPALSVKEYATKYGAAQADADKVKQALEGYGLKVEEVSLPTCSMRVSGTVAAMEKAFQPHLGIYRNAKQGEYRGREKDVKLPAELDDIVTGVFGLDQRQVARRKSQALNVAPAAQAAAAHSLVPLTPADLEARYHFPPGDGVGQEIAIAEFDGGYLPGDLAAFCAKHNRPVPQVTIVPVNLTPLTVQQIMQLPRPKRIDALAEQMMDVQIIAGLCPKAHVSVYFATFDQKGWIDLLNTVIQAKPVTLSISWGAPEDDPTAFSKAARTEINKRLAAAASLGITVCISSGDDGSGDMMTDTRVHVDFPSGSPFVLSVGGTMLTKTGTKVVEQIWWEDPGTRFDDAGNSTGGGSTGGGVSIFFKRPQWQNVHVPSLNEGSIDGRVTPDVTALAGPPFYDLTLLGHDFPDGGTSASAPLWAALIARINALLPAAKKQRFLTPLLYQAGANGQPRGKSACRDVTIGENPSYPHPGIGYAAGSGFDAVSGWGAPNGAALLAALQ